MGAVRRWLLGIVITAFAAALARSLAPQGRQQAVVRLAAGLLLAAAVLRPLGEIRWEGMDLDLSALDGGGAEQAEIYRRENEEALSAIIERRCAAYILDKADRLGLDCRVTVRCAVGGSGVPLPDTATITGPYSSQLAAYIQEEVGIPAEKQIWLEENTWSGNEEKSGP